MPQVLDDLSEGARFAIIRLRSLGDCVLTTPAIRILKQSRPDLEIAVMVEDRFAPVFEDNPDIAAVLPPSLTELRAWKPDFVLNLHGGTRSVAMSAGSGAPSAGFAHHSGSWVYRVRIPRAQEILGEERTVHTAEHLASAVFYLGAKRIPIPRACLFAPRLPSQAPYAVIHPFAALAGKTWAAERFLAVADHLANQGLEPWFIAGPRDDLAPFTGYRRLTAAPLKTVMSVLESATLFVGNDSGPAHMAAAFGIPVIVLFGPSDPVIWAPWRTESKVFASPQGMAGIQVGAVVHAIDHLRVAQ
jgi:heptosyltransferase III